jgi:tetratricopeptide (TPR) repeat protein
VRRGADALVALLAIALASGCTGSPSVQGTPPPAAGAASSPREEGDALSSRGDYGGAVAKYREALGATPQDLKLRYALGTALSQLDRHEETAEQFRWVVEHGAPGHSEVAMARQWLAAAERGPAAEARPSDQVVSESPAPGAESQAASAGVGTIKGKTAWPGVNPDAQHVPLEIRLSGDDAENKDKSFRLRISLGRPYTMPQIPAGAYRVVGRSAGVKLWEARVVIAAGKDTALDLTEANSVVTSKDFPRRADG